jgi:predicted F0F1-ATPase subunit
MSSFTPLKIGRHKKHRPLSSDQLGKDEDTPFYYSFKLKTSRLKQKIRKKGYFEIDRYLEMKRVDSGSSLNIKKNADKDEENRFVLASFVNIGYYILTPIILGVVVGLYFDKIFKTKGFFVSLLIIFGALSSIYNIWKIVKEQK